MKNSGSTALLAAVMAISGCAMLGKGNTGIMMASSTLPASEGKVKYSVTKNDNTRIALTVKHLAHPSKLTPPANVYVVWTRDTKGALKVDKDLNGTLDAETPLHSFEIFLTAEASGEVQQPTDPHLLWTTYNR